MTCFYLEPLKRLMLIILAEKENSKSAKDDGSYLSYVLVVASCRSRGVAFRGGLLDLVENQVHYLKTLG